MNINPVIQQAIELTGSQTALADKAGVSQAAIWKLLHCKNGASWQTSKKLECAVDGEISCLQFADSFNDVRELTKNNEEPHSVADRAGHEESDHVEAA